MRLVGFFRSRELSGLLRSIRITRDRPNASMRSARVSGSGNCRRVAEATPSVLWQLRQLAFSRTGYRPATKEVSCAQAGWRRARADSAIDEILTFDGLPQLSLYLQGVCRPSAGDFRFAAIFGQRYLPALRRVLYSSGVSAAWIV